MLTLIMNWSRNIGDQKMTKTQNGAGRQQRRQQTGPGKFDAAEEDTDAAHHVLGGKVALVQDKNHGHQAGLDAVMLAASISGVDRRSRLVDLGAGVGTAGLCVAARLSMVDVTLVENQPKAIALAKKTLNLPHNTSFSKRLKILEADVTLRGLKREVAGLTRNMADFVIMNPPYWCRDKVGLSPDGSRVDAHVLGEGGLEPWFRTAASILEANGRLSVIFPAAGLQDILSCMASRFADICIIPLYKGEGESAIRVVVTGVKGSRAPLTLTPGIVLHEPKRDGESRRAWTPHADAILKGKATLFI